MLLQSVSQILQVRLHVCDAKDFLTFLGAEIKSTVAFSNGFFVGLGPCLNFGTAYFSVTLTRSKTKALFKIIILSLLQGLTGNLNVEMKSLLECKQQSLKSFNDHSCGALLRMGSVNS